MCRNNDWIDKFIIDSLEMYYAYKKSVFSFALRALFKFLGGRNSLKNLKSSANRHEQRYCNTKSAKIYVRNIII